MKALDLYTSNITEHIAGCDCERCEACRREAMIVHGRRVVVSLFGAEPEALVKAGIENADVGIVAVTKYMAPWTSEGGRPLTQREIATAEMVCAGLSRSQVALAMSMSPKTFDTHRGHALAKLRVANEVQLLRIAIANGWVTL